MHTHHASGPSSVDDADLFDNAFRHAAIGMAVVSTEGKFLKVNPALCELTGYAEAELVTLDFQAITHADDLAQDLCFAQALISGDVQRYEMDKRYIHRTGAVVYIELSVSLVRHADGTPRFFISQMQNVSDRVRSRVELDQFFRLSMNLMATVGTDGFLKQVNPAFSRVLGYSPEELMGQPYLSFIHPDDVEISKASVGRLLVERRSLDIKLRVRHANGYYRLLAWNSVYPSNGDYFYTVAYDLTDMKETVDELESINQRLGSALKELNALRGIVPICSCCKKIRDDSDYWQSLEQYMEQHVGAVFSHGLCPTCLSDAQLELQTYFKKRKASLLLDDDSIIASNVD